MNSGATSRMLPVLLVAAAGVAAQPDQGLVFRSTTRLVEINAIVHDKSGKAVAGLQQDDFEIFEDGKRQSIVLFVAERTEPVRPAALPPHVYSNRLPARTGARSGYTVILLDWLNGIWGDRAFARQQVVRLLTHLQPNDLVMLCVLDRGLRIVHDFTSDTTALLRRLAAEQDRPPFGTEEHAAGPIADASVGSLDLMPKTPADRQMKTFFATRRILDTLTAFEQIARYLSGVPGRKSLVWVSSGFPSALGLPGSEARTGRAAEMRTFGPELSRVFRALNNADISVYPVDARGLPLNGDWAATSTMIEFAARTGGRAYYNRNDLGTAIRSALDDSAISYTLGYRPAEDRMDSRYHEIRVRIRRPGVEVRHRQGYFAGPAPTDVRQARAELERALSSPLDSTVLPISVRANIAGGAAALLVVLDPLSLSLRQESGRWRGQAKLYAAVRRNGSASWIPILASTLQLNLLNDTYDHASREGLVFRQDLTLPADAASLRLVVRDPRSGSVGSLTIPIAAPGPGAAVRSKIAR